MTKRRLHWRVPEGYLAALGSLVDYFASPWLKRWDEIVGQSGS